MVLFFPGEKQFPSSMTSSEEDLLSSDMADVEEQLAQSASSVNTDEGTDDDIGKIIILCQHFLWVSIGSCQDKTTAKLMM